MSSEKMILIGVGLFLYMQMSRSQAAGKAPNYVVPSNNQNADLWLKTGALQLGGQLLKELGNGGWASVKNALPDFSSSVTDSFAGADFGAMGADSLAESFSLEWFV